MRILVTGTAGFIGYHVVLRLLESGADVVGVDNINDYYDVRLKLDRLAQTGIEQDRIREGELVRSSRYPDYQFIKLDIKERNELARLFEKGKFERVCHLAAQAGVRYSLENPHVYVDSNLVGFVNLIDLCRIHGIGHLIYASSSSVYGLNPEMPFSILSETDHPVSLYGATKKCNELIAHSYSHLFGLPTTGLRFFTVYGPWGRPDMAAFVFTKAILENRPIDIYNYGDMERDFTYIDDIVEGVVLVIEHPILHKPIKTPFRVYNIGHGSPVRLLDFVESVEKVLGRKAVKRMMAMQAGDVRATWADTSDLLSDFGYRPMTPVQEGVGRFIHWYLDYYRP